MAEVRTTRGIRRNLLAALLVVLLLGGTATAWSTYVPLEGAVVASGIVVVETNLRKVQHPTGGVVGTLNVREGQRVEAGEIVVRLDDTTTRANLGIVVKELTALRARHARLQAERDGLGQPVFPDDLQGRAGHEPDIAQILAGERTLFRTRAGTRTGQKQQLGERISQLKDEIAGLNEQMQALTKQLVIVRDELRDLSELHERGLAQRPRITSLQREILGKEGTVGEIKAKVAQSLGRIAEIELQVLQLDRDLANEVAKEIREVEIRIAELGERRTAAEDQLKRVDIRVPIAGIVHQLNVHTVGGVISASEAIMLVVPATDTLIVEARINPADIDQLQLGQETRIRFSAFNQRTTPEIMGVVFRIAGDLVKEPQTGLTYYTAGIRVEPAEIARLKGLKLLPGMPAEAYIKTGERTLASYLLRPLLDQMQRALKED
jgi:HlyD family secretion protein